MGLSKCVDCGGSVSDLATSCPHCGRPQDIRQTYKRDPGFESASKVLPEPQPLPTDFSGEPAIPASLDKAIKFIWIKWVLFAAAWFVFDKTILVAAFGIDESRVPSWCWPASVAGMVAVGALVTMLVVKLLKSGRDWFRWVYIVVHFLHSHPHTDRDFDPGFNKDTASAVLTMVIVAINIVITVYLLKKDSKEFFQRKRPAGGATS